MRPKDVLELELWEEWVVLEGAARFYGGEGGDEGGLTPEHGYYPEPMKARTVKQNHPVFDLQALATEGANVHIS